MRRLPAPRRFGFWIGLYALVLQALLPFAQALPGPAGKPLVICSVAGYGTTTAPNRHSNPFPPGGDSGRNCPICTAIHAPTGTLHQAPPIAVPVAIAAPTPSPAAKAAQTPILAVAGFRVRAPPRA